MKKKVILSVAAHGDDAEFLAGGTLAKLAKEGHDVYLAIATDNDSGSHRLTPEKLKDIARPEAEAAARVLGAKEVFLFGYVDGDLCDVPRTVVRGQVMRLIRQLKADIIFSWDPFAPFEDHPDHRAIAWATSDAAAFAHNPLYHPDHLEGGLEPHRVSEWYWYAKTKWQVNKHVDISDTMNQKLQALYAYHCQMVFTVDEFSIEARASGIEADQLQHIDPEVFEPWIDKGMRTANARIGQEIGTAYAEAFRYEALEIPPVFLTASSE